MTFTVYRFYDAADELLYVGRSGRIDARLSDHRRDKPWWREVARIEVGHCATEAEMVEREEQLIVALSPRYNLLLVPGPLPRAVAPPPEGLAGQALVTVSRCAEYFDVAPRSVSRWIERGMPCVRPGGTGRRRIRLTDAYRWLVDQNAIDAPFPTSLIELARGEGW